MVKRPLAIAALLGVCSLGMGYTTRSELPEDIKTIHVAPVQSAIDLSAETGDNERFRVYRPGVEVDVTNAIINRFIFDGNLRVAGPEEADAVCEARLTDYRRDPLRYSEGDDIQEYRLSLNLDVTVRRRVSGQVLWKDTNVIGDTTFFLTGPRAKSEDEAVGDAVEDVARRVVEKTIELW